MEDTELERHRYFMTIAYTEAQKAFANDEVPIGAVVVLNNEIIGYGFNEIEKRNDPCAHAEILAIRQAATDTQSWRLDDAILYVTLEPCMMCLGACLQSRLGTIVYGAGDSRFGALSHPEYQEGAMAAYRRWPIIIPHIEQAQCTELIQTFFKRIRARSKEEKRFQSEITASN